MSAQQPLFDLPTAQPKLDAQARLQALYDSLVDNSDEGVAIIRRKDGWYMSFSFPRWFGDNGLCWIGRDEKGAADCLRGLPR
jgi:hypothetical protein